MTPTAKHAVVEVRGERIWAWSVDQDTLNAWEKSAKTFSKYGDGVEAEHRGIKPWRSELNTLSAA